MEHDIGKFFVIGGIVLICLGIFFMFGERIPFFGKLPGDIKIERDNFIFYFPIVTSIIVSIGITLLLSLFRK